MAAAVLSVGGVPTRFIFASPSILAGTSFASAPVEAGEAGSDDSCAVNGDSNRVNHSCAGSTLWTRAEEVIGRFGEMAESVCEDVEVSIRDRRENRKSLVAKYQRKGGILNGGDREAGPLIPAECLHSYAPVGDNTTGLEWAKR